MHPDHQPRSADRARDPLVVVLLTFNSEVGIAETVTQALKLKVPILAVDSGSTDGTLQILERLGVAVIDHPFRTYGEQRNWSIAQVESRADWQLHLDADEVLDETAIREIQAVVAGPTLCTAYLLRRRDYFMGRELRHSGLNPWHLRLFRSGAARCEQRLYDQHFVAVDGATTGRLQGWMHDKNSLPLTDWIARHNRWATMEAEELLLDRAGGTEQVQPRLFGDGRERARFAKALYYRLPAGPRALLYFVYRYVFRLGFLDGRTGFYFAFFQAFWFRLLVDAKLYERRTAGTAPEARR